MTLPYIKLFGDTSATVDLLSDAEAGRLLKSLLHYANGHADDLPGQEKLVFAMLKAQIDRDDVSYQAFLDKQRENGKKGGRPKNPNLSRENPKNPSLFEKTQKTQEKDKEEEKEEENEEVVVVEDTPAHEEGPFGLTGEDIQASLARDAQIEDAARSVGLQVTEAGMIRARGLAEQYGLDKLLEAIPISVDHPSWAYVEGILRKGVDTSGKHRGNRSKPDGEIRTAYDFLRNDAV